nr:polysaccharide deacetylase family protein [uncultured Blautia sp.]
MKKKTVCVLTVILCASLGLSGCSLFPFEQDLPFHKSETENTDVESAGNTPLETEEEQNAETDEDGNDIQEITDGQSEEEADSPLEQASLMAAQYDYDKAIELLKSQPDYDSNTDMQNAVSEYENTKAACTEYPLEQITHVFFHTLIKDTSKAFDGDSDSDGYNQYMTTIDEFNKIIQSMYDKGYVMVSPHDMATVNEDGTMSRGSIMLPPGKIPFVLSQDDVSYYHYMDGDGFASKLVIDENGDVKNEYIEDDGSVSTGDYDMVPLIDTFVKEHPDFSYHGRKGILAMTGYDGVLGYRTDIAYKTGKNLQDDQKKFLRDHPDFDYKQEVKNAKKVAAAMKAEGWEFASHTWGHKNVASTSLKDLKRDTKKWKKYVAPVLGKTDMIIFAFGADIGSWEGYSSDNAKYEFYKSQGYRYFCNVDSSQYFVQITDDYFRQGRRNLDGYRMYYNPEMLSDLFDVSEVWDSSRPTPVPKI